MFLWNVAFDLQGYVMLHPGKQNLNTPRGKKPELRRNQVSIHYPHFTTAVPFGPVFYMQDITKWQ